MGKILLANWNGEEMPIEEVKVPALDRGYLFGDGIYEVLRIVEGRLWLEQPHNDRLRRSLNEIGIETDVDRLIERMHGSLARSGVRDGLVYIQVTRGAAPRAHRFPEPGTATPNELMYFEEYDSKAARKNRENGVDVIIQPDQRWGRCDVKSINLLGNCLAAQKAAKAGCYEALLEKDGKILEATRTSLFAVIDGVIRTAPTTENILPSVTRAFVITLAKQLGLPLKEEAFGRVDLPHASELFFAGTTSEVTPIRRVDGNQVGGEGAKVPGPIVTKLQVAHDAAVAEWLSNG